jgi:hypothetical protein
MMPAALRSFASRIGPTSARRVRELAGAGWPVLMGLLAFFVGLLMLGAAAFFHRQANQLIEATAQSAQRRIDSPAAPGLRPIGERGIYLPAYETRLDDITLLFKVAAEQGVTLGPIEYRSATGSSLPAAVRELDLRLNEEYPKLKAFLSELLKQMPHLYVREIQVELGTTAASKVQATLKLSVVYQTPVEKGSSPSVAPVDKPSVVAPASSSSGASL